MTKKNKHSIVIDQSYIHKSIIKLKTNKKLP